MERLTKVQSKNHNPETENPKNIVVFQKRMIEQEEEENKNYTLFRDFSKDSSDFTNSSFLPDPAYIIGKQKSSSTQKKILFI